MMKYLIMENWTAIMESSWKEPIHSIPDLMFDKWQAMKESPNVVNTTNSLPRIILQ